jgi:hypothetical protein
MRKTCLILCLLFLFVTKSFAEDSLFPFEIVIYHTKKKISWTEVSNADGYELKAVKAFVDKKEEVDLTKFIRGRECFVQDTFSVLDPKEYYDIHVRSYRIINNQKVYGNWSKSTDKERAVLDGKPQGWRIHYYKPNNFLGTLVLLLLSS